MAFASVAMLKHIFLVFVLAASFRNTVDAARRKQTKDANGEADDRLKHLITKFQTQNVIALTDLNFTKFVTLRPRDYVAVVMFTLANRHDCDICKATMPTFNEVASLYHLQYNFNSSEPKDRLAFFVVDADRAGRTFEELKLETVPRFYVLPPRSESDVKLKMSDFELSNREIIGGMETAVAEVNKYAGTKIVITVDPKPLLAILGAVAVILAFTVSAASTDIRSAVFWYRTPYLWMAVSVLCFCVGVSGSLYCYIRGAPNYGFEERNVPRFFAGPGRDQYFIEGLIVAAWTVGCALAGIALLYSTKLPFAPVRHVMVVLSMSVFIVLGMQIWEAYIDKTRWYQMKDTFPPELWRFLSTSVKKSSGLLKRLVRVSEIWMFEYKNFATFQSRSKVLVMDYIKRSALKVIGVSS